MRKSFKTNPVVKKAFKRITLSISFINNTTIKFARIVKGTTLFLLLSFNVI